jgi:hypothetical protein
MKPLHYLFLLLLAVISACESLVTTVSPDKLPPTESKLVVQSFISPQANRLTVIVTESIPLFGETSSSGSVVKNAVVKMSDGVKEVTFPYDSASASYSIEKALLAVVAGKTYKLSVTDGKRSVQAACTVPITRIPVKSYVIDTTYTPNSFNGDTAITIKMTWQDIAGEANYYRLRASLDVEYSIPEGASATSTKERRVRNRLNVDWDDAVGRRDYVSDASLDGTVFSSPTGRFRLPEVIRYTLADGRIHTIYPKCKIIAIIFEIDNTEESYFRYHRSVQLRNTDNPFSEPSLIFSNINGGLGCFSAYNAGSAVYRPQQ